MARAGGWVTLQDLQTHIGGTFTPNDTTFAQFVVDATNDAIVEWHPEWGWPDPQTGGPFTTPFDSSFTSHPAGAYVSAKHRLGALKLAAKLYNRRGAMGDQSFAQFDGAPFAQMGFVDAEISALLDINRSHSPLVA